jgi:alpha-D-xyloside xylohydrolase
VALPILVRDVKIRLSAFFVLLLLGVSPLSAQQNPSSIKISFTNQRGQRDQLELTEISRDGAPMAASDLRVHTLRAGVTEIASDSGALANWEFHIRESGPVYGFGERFNALAQNNNILVNASRDAPGVKGTTSYKPMPFFMALRGYGLWLDTYSEAVFDLGVARRDEIMVRFRDARLRVLIFEGPELPVILERFTGVIGRAKLPPYWAFTPWKSRNWHPNMDAVYEDVEKYRQLGIPGSVLVIDSPWETNYNTFEVNRQQFGDPETMVEHIHDLGFKLCLWLTPFINRETFKPSEPELAGKIPLTEASNFEEARRAAYFVKDSSGDALIASWWKGRGGLIDFTNPAAKAWWQDQVRKAVRLGADAFKDDDGEGNFVTDARFASGEDAAVMRTRYAVLYNQAVEEIVEKDLHGDGVLLMRSGSVGNHNLPFFWAGDNEANFGAENGLPGVVLAGLNAGLSGMPLWTSDLGGYIRERRTPDDDVLFIRWTEFAAFSPIMQVHSAINLGPWDYGEQALDIFRRYSRLHMSLFPYRYAAAQESSRTGMPLMRALVLFHAQDAEARAATDEYYFGPDLLVAPVITPGTQRSVYLPAGEWIDYWTGKRISGPRNLVVEAPLERIPLFVKAGAILPKIPEEVMTLVPWKGAGPAPVPALDDRRIYEIYPGGARELQDFEGRELKVFELGKEKRLEVSGRAARVTLTWRFDRPATVMLDGRPLELQMAGESSFVTFAHLERSEISWR